jgi:tRNA-dihydrouridine synthase B
MKLFGRGKRQTRGLPNYWNESVIERIQRDAGVDRETARTYFNEMLVFLDMVADSKKFISPPEAVDVAWHAFILHTRDYEHYCQERFGRVIHHQPTGAPDPDAYRRAYERRASAPGHMDNSVWVFPAAAAPRVEAGEAAEVAVAEPPALTEPWSLGGLRLSNRLVLAPLAGIGNWFVRLQAKRFGAGLVVSEMVSSFGLAYGNERTVREFLRIHPGEHPVSIQLFGHDTAIMREAAAMVADAGADLIDINMGCPVKKVCKTGAGAALLDDPARAIGIAAAAREGGGLPVTVKLRPGRAPGDRAGVELARRLAEEAGVAGIGFHPRHASQQHSGGPDYALARELAGALEVPVMLSGGLSDEESALSAYATSGAAALMLARGSFGNPWRFGRLLGTYEGEPATAEIVAELEWVIAAAEDHLGRERAGRYLRKFYPWYADTLGLTRRERQALVTAPTTAAAREALGALGTAEPALAA